MAEHDFNVGDFKLNETHLMHMGKQYTANPKRKFRWGIQILDIDPGSSEGIEEFTWYVKTFARPTLTIEETQLDFRHERMYLAGKQSWETISMTVLDVEKNDGVYQWLNHIYHFNDADVYKDGVATEEFAFMGYDEKGEGKKGDGPFYKKTCCLALYDARGTIVEAWKLFHTWPTSSNFGDLDYSSSDTCDIEMTLRFDRAARVPVPSKGAAPE